MSYITRLHVERCRNVRDLDVDLSPQTTRPGPVDAPTAFRHLILTGPNGSGKSGILEAIADALIRTLFSEDASRRILKGRSDRNPSAPPDHEQSGEQHGPRLDLTWDTDRASLQQAFAAGDLIAAFLPSRRQIGRHDVRGPKKLEWKPAQLNPTQELAVNLLQFLVNKQTDRAFAMARNDAASATRIEQWLLRFGDYVRRLTDDPGLRIEFDERSYNFRFHRTDGYIFDLNTLADGHSAAFSILAELLIRVDAVQRLRNDYSFDPAGIVLIDEIETHLHLSLQEQILPFITATFPRLQILVATHSPAVIASISGAVVCDLGTREQVLSNDYRGVPYGTLMKDHFGISSEIDLDSTRKLLRLRELAAAAKASPADQRSLHALAAELSNRSPALATEVWMVMQHITGSTHVEAPHD